MNSSLMLDDALFVAAISRNGGEKRPPRKSIQESYPVYPIYSVVVVTAVGEGGDGFIGALVQKTSWGWTRALQR